MPPVNKARLQSWHRLECDRDEQFDYFRKIFFADSERRCHFFALLGDEADDYSSFIDRIQAYLQGCFSSGSDYKVVPLSLPPFKCDALESTKFRLAGALFQMFDYRVSEMNKHGDLAAKDFAYLVRNSKSASARKAQHCYCVRIKIVEDSWKADVVPELFQWFARDFCSEPLRPEQPMFIFFLCLEHKRADMEAQAQQAYPAKLFEQLHPGQFFSALPKFEDVLKKDIGLWFHQKQPLSGKSTAVWEGFFERYFSRDESYKMNITQKNLEIIINEIKE